ncbi:MAG TPA: hypothetical protein VJU87_06545 [Gemmatimonadaceae bacterium]|nr:hypothetical protein [Gemmatimonadaceae bacterium]
MRISLITGLLLLIPAFSGAQGFPGRGQPRGGRTLPELRAPAPGDTASNTVALLIASRGRLILEEDQIMQLSVFEARLRFQQDSLQEGIDSLRTQLMPPGDGYGVMTPEQWQHMREKRRVLASMLAAERDVEQTATDSALAVLSEAQRRTAATIIAESERRRADAQRSAAADSTGASRRGINFPGGGKRPD